ncbi:MAG TPA: pitrilysin family protein, partial [Gammaproteobacteria bacterium]|nr:pitrilysin family protein [Gammaproteobacteria bacterium]
MASLQYALKIATLTFASIVLAACATQQSNSTATGASGNANGSSSLAQKIPDLSYTEFKLKNGLTVIVHEDHKAPIVAVNTWYHVGSKNEPAGRFGFAHLFEHLMFNGSEHYPGEFFAPFAQVGATDQNGTTNTDRTNYFENVPSNALDLALWMESDRMGWLLPAVDKATLDEQRGVVQNEKRQGENQPYGKVWLHIAHATYPMAHPYHHTVIGTMEDLDAATLDDVRDWFKTYYGPNNAVLSIAGDVDPAQVKQKVIEYYGNIPATPPLSHMQAWTAKRHGMQHEVMQDRVPAARVYMVWNVPAVTDPAADYLQLLASVLSDGKASRLYKRLVYDDQVASNVEAFLYGREIASQFIIMATAVPGGSLDKVKADIRDELVRLLKNGPTPAELQRAQAGLYASFTRGIERIGGFGGISGILASSEVYYGDPDAYKDALKRQLTATTADLKQVANEWLSDGVYVLDVEPFGDHSTTGNGADRSNLPQVAGFPHVSFPTIESATLPNGMKLVVAHHGDLPLINLSLQINAGYAADEYAVPGTAKLALDALSAGTTDHGALEISKRLNSLGATLGTDSSLDTSSVGMSALKAKLDPSLALFADVILHPTYPDENVAKLRKQQLAEIRQEKHQPTATALRLMPQLLYGEQHAYSMPLTGSGYVETVSKLTPADLEKFHNTWFKPNNATLIVVGDTSLAEIQPKIEQLFGSWQKGDVPNKQIPHVAPPAKTDVYLVNRPGSEQSIIFAGTLAPPHGADNHIAISAMNGVFGGDFNARVNMDLREDKHWAYGAYSFMYPARGQEPFIIYAPVQTDKTAEAMAEIEQLATGFVNGKPATSEELARVTNKRIHSLAGRWETNDAVAASIGALVSFDLPHDYWDTYPKRLKAVDLKDVHQAAKEVIDPHKLVWVVIGDLDRVGDAIRKLDLGEIHYIDANGKPVPG